MSKRTLDWLDGLGGDEHELSHLPEGSDKSFLAMLAVWGGAAFVPFMLVVGGGVAGQLTLSAFVTTFAIGYTLAAFVGVLIAFVAWDYGLTFHVTSRYFFGTKGSIIPSGLQVVTRAGFAATEVAIGAAFVTAAFGTPIPYTFQVAALVLGIAYISTAFIGIDALKWISYIAIPVTAIVFTYGAIRLNLGSVGAVDDPMSWTAAVSLAFSAWIAGGIVSGDWLRYARSKTSIVGSTWIAVVIFSGFLTLLGFLSVYAAGTPNLQDAMIEVGLAVPAAIAVVVLLWTTVDNWLYSASLGLANIFDIRKVFAVSLTGAIIVVVAMLQVNELIIPFLNAVGVVVPPIAAPIIAEYYVLGNDLGKFNFEDIDYSVNWVAIISWAIGSSVAFFLSQRFMPAIIGIIVAFFAYLVIYQLGKDTGLYPINSIASDGTAQIGD